MSHIRRSETDGLRHSMIVSVVGDGVCPIVHIDRCAIWNNRWPGDEASGRESRGSIPRIAAASEPLQPVTQQVGGCVLVCSIEAHPLRAA